MVRNLSVTVLLVCGFAAPRADASNGEGFFSISISDDSAFLNVTAVDSNTLLPLPDTFTANEAGEYFLEGLVILDGDTANPIGDFQIIGQGDPELETTFRITTEDVNDPFGILLFASMVVGIKIEDAGLNRQYENLQTHLSIQTTGNPGSPPVNPQTSASIFVETDDGFSANAIDAGVGGSFAIPGTTTFDSGIVQLPELPKGTTEDDFGVLVIQNDIGLFDMASDTNITFASTVHTHIFVPPSGIPGDYNNDGVVNAGDYVVFRDNLGLAVVLPNDVSPGTVEQSDYGVWVNNFGTALAEASLAAKPPGRQPSAIPEPAGFGLVVAAIAAVFIRDREFWARGIYGGTQHRRRPLAALPRW